MATSVTIRFKVRVLLMSGKFNRESVLTQLVDFYQKRRPRTGVRGIKLLHDNAQAHKSELRFRNI